MMMSYDCFKLLTCFDMRRDVGCFMSFSCCLRVQKMFAERGQIKDCILQVPCRIKSFTEQPMYLLTLNMKCFIYMRYI